METIRKMFVIIFVMAIVAILANGIIGVTERILAAKVGIESEMEQYHALMEEVRSECFADSN